MAITVAMIEEKEFKIKMRGYDPSEVDEFLDDICDEMVALQEEIATLNQRLSQSAQNSAYAPAAVPAPAAPVPAAVPAPVPAPIPAPIPVPVKKEEPAPQRQDVSEAAQKLLARAQKVYDETVADAKEEAQGILEEAKQKAAEQIGSLEEQRNTLMKEVDNLKAAARDFRERFQCLIEEQANILNTESKLFE